MGRAGYGIEVMRNMHTESDDYLEAFGFRLLDPYDGAAVRTFLLHQIDLVLSLRLSKQARATVEQVREGHNGT